MKNDTNTMQKEIELGLVPEFVIALVKTDPEVNSGIAKAREDLDATDVKFRMRYNCWTVDQFAELCGRSKSHITNLTLQPQLVNGKITVALNHCHPFPSSTMGPKFIVRDDKSIDYLLSCI